MLPGDAASGAVLAGGEPDWPCANAAGVSSRPAATRVIAPANPMVGFIKDLLALGSMQAVAVEIDHQIRRIWLVRLETRRAPIGPIREVHHHRQPALGLLGVYRPPDV